MTPPTWGLAGVEVRYGDTLALDGVALVAAPGTVTSVVGGDGAGKTTLARTLVGLVRPTAGQVRRPRRDRIGYQSERSGVWADLSVLENLEFVATAHRLTAAERERRIDRLLDLTRLGTARTRLAAHLSGGMRQKLGVAMALLPGPELLVLDEPTTGLDPVSRVEVWSLVSGAAAGGAAVVATTTYLDEPERAARVLALDSGHTLAEGTIDEVRSSLPGIVAVVPENSRHHHRWRRGSSWRAWFPDGVADHDAVPIEPDLTDVITVAALGRRGAP